MDKGDVVESAQKLGMLQIHFVGDLSQDILE